MVKESWVTRVRQYFCAVHLAVMVQGKSLFDAAQLQQSPHFKRPGFGARVIGALADLKCSQGQRSVMLVV